MADITQTDDGKNIFTLSPGDAALIYDSAEKNWMLSIPKMGPESIVPEEILALTVAMLKLKDPETRAEMAEEFASL